jgi:hypothetical protein
MKPKIKILFLVILLCSFFLSTKNNNKNLKLRLKVRVTSLLEVNFRKAQLFFLKELGFYPVYSMKQPVLKMLNLKITAIILEGIVLKKKLLMKLKNLKCI